MKKYQSLSDELAEFIRKLDYRFSKELKGSEGGSRKRVIEQFALVIGFLIFVGSVISVETGISVALIEIRAWDDQWKFSEAFVNVLADLHRQLGWNSPDLLGGGGGRFGLMGHSRVYDRVRGGTSQNLTGLVLCTVMVVK